MSCRGLKSLIRQPLQYQHRKGHIGFIRADAIANPKVTLRIRNNDMVDTKPTIKKWISALNAANYGISNFSNFNQKNHNIPPVDIALIDLSVVVLDQTLTNTITAFLPKARKGLIFIIDAQTSNTLRYQLSQYGDIRDETISAAQIVDLCNQLIRLKIIEKETVRRCESFVQIGRSVKVPPFHVPNKSPVILIAGEPGPAALSLVRCAEKISNQVICAFRPGQALRALENENIDAAIFIPQSKSDPLQALARAMRRHTQYQYIPVFQAVSHMEYADTKNLFGTVINYDHLNNQLPIIINAELTKSKQLQHFRNFLRDCNIFDLIPGHHSIKSDKKAMKDILSIYGENLCHTADLNHDIVSFLALRMHPTDNLNFSADIMSAQSIPLITRLTRSEDFLTAISIKENEIIFCISFIRTHKSFVQKTADRISSVIRNTMFHDNSGNPAALDIQTCVVERPAGLRIEETIARLLASFSKT